MSISSELRVGVMFLGALTIMLLVIVWLTQWGQTRHMYSIKVRFAQAQGLYSGNTIRVAGVNVGQVGNVTLDQETNLPLVECHIENGVRLCRNYHYEIEMGGLVGDHYIEITPVTKDPGDTLNPGDIADGTASPDINSLLSTADKLVTSLNSTAEALNDVIGSPQSRQDLKGAISDLKHTTASVAQLSEGLNTFTGRNMGALDTIINNLSATSADVRRVSDTVAPQLANTDALQNIEIASRNLASMTTRLDKAAADVQALTGDPELANSLRTTSKSLQASSEQLNAILADAKKAGDDLPDITGSFKKASADLPDITASMKQTTAALPGLTDSIQKATADLPDIMASMKTASADLPDITSSFRKASTDLPDITSSFRKVSTDLPDITASMKTASADLPGITASMKKTMSDVSDTITPFKDIAPSTAASLKVVVANLQETSERIGYIVERLPGPSTGNAESPTVSSDVRIVGFTDEGPHSRTDAAVDIYQNDHLVRVGMANLGYNNTVNLQLGTHMKNNDWFRYGLVESRAGVGLDMPLGRSVQGTVEVFGVDNPEANLIVERPYGPFGPGWSLTAGWFGLGDDGRLGVGASYKP